MELLNYPPTRWGNRQIMILHEGWEYRLNFYPLAGMTPTTPAGDEAQVAFDAFLRTFSFLPATRPIPTPTITPVPTPSPSAVATATPYLGTDVVVSCHEVWPGLPSCGMYHAPLVGGRLAFVDPRPGLDNRPFVVDLENDDVRVLGEQEVSLVSWSPSGEHLLARRSQHEYVVYSVDGTEYEISETIGSPPFWAPADALFGATDWLAIPTADGGLRALAFPQGESRNILPAGSLAAYGPAHLLWSSEGRLAWSLSMDQVAEAGELEQVLQVGSADGNREIITWPLSDDARQTYYQLLDWVPGTPLLLAAQGKLANSLWSWAVPLATVNAETGEIRELDASMLLTPESHAWHPTQPGLLALAEGGGRYLTDPNRLALLDVISGELRPLTGEGMSVFEPAWSPDGQWLAYAAAPVPPDAQGDGPALERVLEGRAIYVLDPDTGESHALTDPGDAIDGWPSWSAGPLGGGTGGNYLLYTRQHDGYTDVHVAALDGSRDEILLTGLPDPICFYGGCNWGQMLAYHADTMDDLIRALLRDYSQALSSGQITQMESYAPAMRELIAERRAYYQEFHQVALHSSLLGVHSRYEIDSIAPDPAEEGLYDVQAVEVVTLRGRYREPTREEYTSTRAALWALARTDHPAIQEALQEHIDREMAGYLARLNIGTSYETVWIVRHHLLIREGADGPVIVQDTFDDKANENPDGTDVVDWIDGQFVRRKPNLTLWPDYAMYHEPLEKVEAVGRRLLESYTQRYGGTPAPDPHPGWLTYTHPTYGFSFRHPPDWQPVDEPEVPNILRLHHGKPDAVELTIGFRRPEEEARIQRTGVGAGDVETQGSVRFLGRDLVRQVLIYEGQVKAVLYNNACEIDVDGLIFTLSLDVRGPDCEAARIAPELQVIADEIVGSFLLSADQAEP
jgi:hypothetical protein